MSIPYIEHRLTLTDKPQGPFDSGVSGDHAAARVVFEALPEGVYRLEAVTGAGEFDVTENRPSQNGEWVQEIPSAWTAAGILQLRLVQLKVENGAEAVRRYFPPVLLRFAYRDEGNAAVTAAPVWREVCARAEHTLTEAKALTMAAEETVAHAKAGFDDSLLAAVNAQSMAELFAERAANVLSQVKELSGLTAEIRQVVGV